MAYYLRSNKGTIHLDKNSLVKVISVSDNVAVVVAVHRFVGIFLILKIIVQKQNFNSQFLHFRP